LDYIVRSRVDWIEQVHELDPGAGLILLVAGLVYVLMGWRVFNVLVTINCAALGAALGGGIGSVIEQSSWFLSAALGLAGAILLGALAVRLIKAGVVLCCGLAGAFVGIIIASVFSSEPTVQLAGGIVTLLLTVSLVFVMFDHLVIVTMSLQGALMTVAGVVAAFQEEGGILRHFHQILAKSGFFLIFSILALMVIGICVQLAGVRDTGQPAKAD